MHRCFLDSYDATDWYGLQKVTTNTVNYFLGSKGGHNGILWKLGYKERDRTPIRLRTHQARHYLSTAAERGAMAQEDLAKWAGRATLTCIIHEGPDSTAKGRDRRRNGSRTSLPASGAGV